MSRSNFPWHELKANTLRTVVRDLRISSASSRTRDAMLEAIYLVEQQGIQAFNVNHQSDTESAGSETRRPGPPDSVSTQTVAVNEAGGSVSTGEGALRRSTRNIKPPKSMSAFNKKTKHASAGVAGPSATTMSQSLSASTSQVAAGQLTSEADTDVAVSGSERSNRGEEEDPPPPYVAPPFVKNEVAATTANELPKPQEGPA
ncbi:hypothetical protein BDZ89DRAFT_1152630 [Hymenopellis radicata]|nr:hypothetical protein BDZ89DRAFT_1152630 [Hymenopellis radicata]